MYSLTGWQLLVVNLWFVASVADMFGAVVTFAAAVRLQRMNGKYAHRLALGLALIAVESVTAACTVPILMNHAPAHDIPLNYEAARLVGRSLKAAGQWALALYFLGVVD